MTIDEVINIIKSGEEMDLADARLAFRVVFERRPGSKARKDELLEAITARLRHDHPEQFDDLNHASHYTADDYLAYLKGEQNLVSALWWFIENVSDDTPGRTDMFFHLRERVRSSRK